MILTQELIEHESKTSKTLYNYIGWGLDGGEYDGACVPNHILDTYNNREVTKPRNNISKLDMAKLL